MTEHTEKNGERIAKVIARAGICSRRDAEALIEMGRVKLNNQRVMTPATLVTEDDDIVVDGKLVPKQEPPRVWRFHKPVGLMTTHKDPEGRPTVFERLPQDMPRVISVGRLDMNSEGLLLLTNDGELARKLELPSNGWTRKYRVRVFGRVQEKDLERLANGMTVDGIKYGPVMVTMDRQQGANAWLEITLQEGKNREIRRLMEAIGLSVNRLIRVNYGPFALGSLPVGACEELPPKVLKETLGDAVKDKLRSLAEDGRERKRREREGLAPEGKAKAEVSEKSDTPKRKPKPRQLDVDAPWAGASEQEKGGKVARGWKGSRAKDAGKKSGGKLAGKPKSNGPAKARNKPAVKGTLKLGPKGK